MNRIAACIAILSTAIILPCISPPVSAQGLFASNAYFTVGQTPVKVFAIRENDSVCRTLTCITGGVYFLEINNPNYATNTVEIKVVHADLSTTNTVEGLAEQLARISASGTRLNPTNTVAGQPSFKWDADFPFKGIVYAVVDLTATNVASTNATVQIKEYMLRQP
jgi:hypothetical protein